MKLINFVQYKDFKPMLNPWEMFSLGIHGGAFCYNMKVNPKLITALLKNNVSIDHYRNVNKNRHNNYFNTYALPIFNPSITTTMADVSTHWLIWYIDFYYDHKRIEIDRMMVDHWKMVMRLWKENMSGEENQTFLEYGWWYKQEPNKWIII